MIVHLDTSALIDVFTGARRSLPALTRIVSDGHRIGLSTIVLYEWLRGPRVNAELSAQEAVLSRDQALRFGAAEAALAANLYRTVTRPRGREIDLAIAATAMAQGAALWTLNGDDFRDIAGLTLI